MQGGTAGGWGDGWTVTRIHGRHHRPRRHAAVLPAWPAQERLSADRTRVWWKWRRWPIKAAHLFGEARHAYRPVPGDLVRVSDQDLYAVVRGLIAAEPPADAASGVSGSLSRLCRAAVRGLRASGAGMSVMTGTGIRGVTAASDPEAERIEEIQFTTGEGPCLDAFHGRRPVLVSSLADGASERWPGWVVPARASGIGAVFAIPLQIGAARLGVLDIFRRDPSRLAEGDLALALTFAEVAVSHLLDSQQEAGAAGDPDRLGESLGSRTVLFQAQGMVMVQIGGSITDAMAAIRAHAYAEDRRLNDVATDIVAGRLRLDSPRP